MPGAQENPEILHLKQPPRINAHTHTLYIHTCIYTHMYIRVSVVQKNSVLNTHNAHTHTLYVHTCIYTHMYIRVSVVQKNSVPTLLD